MPVAALSTACRTCSLSSAWLCSRASVPPFLQLTAWSVINVGLSQARDASFDRTGGRVPDADVVGYLAGEALRRGAAHQPEVLRHLRVIHDFEKRRLLELN